MHRTIRLTGRRQLAKSSVAVRVTEVGEKRLLTIAITDPKVFRGFPEDARISVRLTENKQMESVQFGAVGSPRHATEINNTSFGDPSCQLRVASASTDQLGLLLGSSDSWRLNSEKEHQEGGSKGILRFLPKDIAPRVWKLDIQENAHPVVQIDKRIPDARTWVRTDPVFISAVLPAILYQVFDDVLSQDSPQDTPWMKDWIMWADSVMPGKPPPASSDEVGDRRRWIEDLIDSFCQRHHLSDRIVDMLTASQVDK
ncbi:MULTISPECIES: hypothetical protein [unclassified Mesorhizobium]|uniref:hypothetical protein n=1 Tax=unclassified Mesorhizobium TaxID=325217 RepID=UPI0003CE85B4|nr:MULTISPECIES: hypothetical protein [unclassified Mesorhizobium]ESX34543.1 hypothetical protein X764_28340 [Mesorhizobium sp. LSHC440A00]WJI56450.1 hypothetical protein NLY33_25245 [Mesorhizobium sp. C432A]